MEEKEPVHSHIKERLVEVAASIFQRFGFAKATMDEIARAAGKKKSALYYYFNSKEAVFQAVLEREADEFRTSIRREVLVMNFSPADKLRAYVQRRLAFLSRFGNYYAFVMNREAYAYTSLERVRQRFDREEEALLAQLAEEGIQQGVFRLTDQHFAARSLLTIIKGFELAVFVSRIIDIEELEQRVDELLDILLYGLLLDTPRKINV